MSNAVPFEVDAKIANFENLCSFICGRAPQRGANARQQLVHPERLGDIIVSSGVKRLYFGLLFASDRKHDDRNI